MPDLTDTSLSLVHKAMQHLKKVQDALGTAETGNALVEVARNAHAAEQKLAAFERDLDAAQGEEDAWQVVRKYFPVNR